ncbi:hypothetical protein GALMADRAFT_227630 [Galerina marginata CBS 339.88]|uniref:Uncharacterized protein n=1 Tax=Galerina marginata (strain CBS 339.88) TaxID=685588 RepID=A0A067T4C9_GALM3|nr:hypothetical protein GALMADRAFT_227630 [Galerina marginata CBS 339.88]
MIIQDDLSEYPLMPPLPFHSACVVSYRLAVSYKCQVNKSPHERRVTAHPTRSTLPVFTLPTVSSVPIRYAYRYRMDDFIEANTVLFEWQLPNFPSKPKSTLPSFISRAIYQSHPCFTKKSKSAPSSSPAKRSTPANPIFVNRSRQWLSSIFI